MQDRRVIRGAPGGRTPIEIVGEDRFDRSVGARAYVDRPHGGGIEPLLPVGSSEPDDAETGAEALFRMHAFVEDQIAQRRSGRPDCGGLLADALDGPAGMAPMTGCHCSGTVVCLWLPLMR